MLKHHLYSHGLQRGIALPARLCVDVPPSLHRSLALARKSTPATSRFTYNSDPTKQSRSRLCSAVEDLATTEVPEAVPAKEESGRMGSSTPPMAPSPPLLPPRPLRGVEISVVQPTTPSSSEHRQGTAASQLPADEASSSKPFMLQLPDLDGVGMTSSRAWPAIASVFELHTLQLKPEHDSSFAELVDYIKAYLEAELADAPLERSVYVLGEGFGAVVALAVALDCKHLVHRLILVNPSTSYPASLMARLAPLLASMPPLLYAAMPLALAPALIANSDPTKLIADIFLRGGRAGGGPAAPPEVTASDAAEVLSATLNQLREIPRLLPTPEALSRRLQLLASGAAAVELQLASVEQRTMVLVGGRDLALPSEEEGKRIAEKMQRAFVKVLPESGHAPLAEPNFDLVALLECEGFLTRTRTFTSQPGSSARARRTLNNFGTAVPIEMPSREEVIRAGAAWTSTLRTYCSPVFFSTLPDGRVVEGLEGVPDAERPLLFVGNHQLYAQDMNIMVEEVFLQKGLLMRGLAHPTLFAPPAPPPQPSSSSGGSGSEDAGTPKKEDSQMMNSSMSNLFRTFGAVEVTPQSFYRLLQQKESVLLYPGGIREGFKRKNEKYELFWPQRPEFVRMAARFQATVVPLSAIGFEDSITLLLDSDEMQKNAWLGPKVREIDAASRSARSGVSLDPDNDQSFIPPLIAPQIPARMYFLFGKPIPLTPDLYEDRAKCQEVYGEIREQVEGGIGRLLRSREQDPYKDFIPRYLYENPPLGGAKRKAPTFSTPTSSK